jgi:hypothetical protein
VKLICKQDEDQKKTKKLLPTELAKNVSHIQVLVILLLSNPTHKTETGTPPPPPKVSSAGRVGHILSIHSWRFCNPFNLIAEACSEDSTFWIRFPGSSHEVHKLVLFSQ